MLTFDTIVYNLTIVGGRENIPAEGTEDLGIRRNYFLVFLSFVYHSFVRDLADGTWCLTFGIWSERYLTFDSCLPVLCQRENRPSDFSIFKLFRAAAKKLSSGNLTRIYSRIPWGTIDCHLGNFIHQTIWNLEKGSYIVCCEVSLCGGTPLGGEGSKKTKCFCQ